jgi:hypothetical protein
MIEDNSYLNKKIISGITYSAVYESFIKMYIFDRISRITKSLRCLSQER